MKDNETYNFIKWGNVVKMQRSNCQVASDFGHHFPIYKFFVQCPMVKKPPNTKSRSARLSGKPTGMSSTGKKNGVNSVSLPFAANSRIHLQDPLIWWLQKIQEFGVVQDRLVATPPESAGRQVSTCMFNVHPGDFPAIVPTGSSLDLTDHKDSEFDQMEVKEG